MSADTLELRRALTQGDFDRFAALSGDDNPIHVDPAFSARTRFGRTVSHGILLVSILRGLAEKLSPGVALDRHEVRFPAPTFADEPMVFRVWRDGGAIAFECRREAGGVITCDGRFAPLPLEGGGVGGEGVSGVSSSEARSAPSQSAQTPSRPRLHPQPNPSPLEGEGLAETCRTFSQSDIDAYVALGGEPSPNGELPYPLISALFSYLLGVKLPGPGANYLKQETGFLAPARIGEALTARVEITRRRPEKSLTDLSTTCVGEDGRVLATGRALIYVADVAQ